MNSNRTRYASTPTYGMQKRGFAKKPTASRQIPQAPDFSQAPDPLSGMPFQPQQAPVQPVMNQPIQQTGAMPMPPFYPQAGMPPLQPMANPAQPVQQMNFAAPTFVQSGMPLPPLQNMPQQPLSQPLGNSVPPMQPGAFTGRAQGFVPPKPAEQPAAPSVQPAIPNVQMPFAPMQQPFAGMQSPMQASPQQPFGFAAAPPQTADPFTQPAPVQPVPQQAYQQPQPKQTITADQVWSVFLFVVLPLLFVPCLFATGIWSAVRYVFIGAAIIGLSAMWYRQMFNPTVRLVVSVLYVALCIGSLAMLMQGQNDVKQTSAPHNQTTAAQQQQQQDASVPAVSQPTAEPEPTPTPLPVSGPSQAEQRLELFMNLWQVNNTTEMVHLVQPSWCSQQENPSMALFMVLANRTPEEFIIEEITGSETDNSRTITMRATINKNTGKAPSVYRFMIMMVKEGDEWYVNPNSLATNDKESTATDENVVKTQQQGNTTEAPRTTVTPAPPASTTLYYNMGGNYYHMDPNCPSVNADNLPFDSTFPYSDLKAIKQSGLLPCLKCGAPTNTLEDAGLQ